MLPKQYYVIILITVLLLLDKLMASMKKTSSLKSVACLENVKLTSPIFYKTQSIIEENQKVKETRELPVTTLHTKFIENLRINQKSFPKKGKKLR